MNAKLMNLEDELPLILYTNAGRAEEARKRVLNMFLDEELEVERVAAMLPEWVGRTPRGQSRQSYAAGLTLRTALRTARKRGAHAVLVFSDEAVLEADFRERIGALSIPTDWGLLVLGEGGGKAGVSRVNVFSIWNAIAVRREHYARVMRLLRKDRSGRVAWMPGQRCAVPQAMHAYAVTPTPVKGMEDAGPQPAASAGSLLLPT